MAEESAAEWGRLESLSEKWLIQFQLFLDPNVWLLSLIHSLSSSHPPTHTSFFFYSGSCAMKLNLTVNICFHGSTPSC